MPLEERLGSLVPGAEMGTLNMGTMNFGDEVFVNSRPDIVEVARRLRGARPGGRSARSTTPACSTRSAGSSPRGTCGRPTTSSSCSACPAACSASERNLRFLVESLPEPVHWSVAGIGRHELPMAEVALRLGGHVRVGLEDNLFLAKGVLASGSDQLVAAAAGLASAAGRRLATPAEARALLGLPGPAARPLP